MNNHYKRLVVALIAVVLAAAAAPTAIRAEETSGKLNCLGENISGCTHGLPTVQYELLLAQMLAHPTPDVRQIEVNNREIRRYSFYRVNKAGAVLYSGPGGAPVDSIAPGFVYVGIRQRSGDWAEIRPGQWIPLADLTAASTSNFAGVLFDSPPAYPMAWMLLSRYASSYPGGPADQSRPAIRRYTRMNIYATVNDGQWDWYLIGPGQWVEQRLVARVLPVERPEETKGRWISVDLYEQVLIAFEDDRMVYATLVSSGLPQWSTNEGFFNVWARFESDGMSGAMGAPDFYQLPAVPYVMYFDNDISLHGTYWHDGFGYRHSHGCVNLSITDSRWLYEWTNNYYAATSVHVWSSGQY